MRGHLQPAHKFNRSESQSTFTTLSRSRRMKLAKTAKTTLVKADQCARGAAVAHDVSEALEGAVKTHLAAKKK